MSEIGSRLLHREPLRVTVLRTGMIAIVAGAVVAGWRGGLSQRLTATLLVLWPSFGGHWVKVWFLNWLRPRLSGRRSAQVAARAGVWFVGGTGLAMGMGLTAMEFANFRPARWPGWWLGGFAFIGIELAVHLVLQLRGRPSFYNGHG